MTPYIQNYPRIKYVKNRSVLFLQNWHKCYELSSGQYINYLMDDDLFEPEKIEKMMSYVLQRDDITLVTSCRQIIDSEGNHLPAIPETMRLYEQTTIVNSMELGNYVLTHCRNVIGEPTSVLFRKKDLIEPFGVYHGRQFVLLNDLVSWLSLLSKGNAVYCAETLSYFRRHQGQNSLTVSIVAKGIHEWLECIEAARKDGFLDNGDLLRAALNAHRNYLQSFPAPGMITKFTNRRPPKLCSASNQGCRRCEERSQVQHGSYSLFISESKKDALGRKARVRYKLRRGADRRVMKRLVIWGCGGHAREVNWLCEQLGYEVVGFLDKRPEMKGQIVNDIPVLGDLCDIEALRGEAHIVCAGVGDPALRKRFVHKTLKEGFQPAGSLIHPGIQISKRNRIEKDASFVKVPFLPTILSTSEILS